jgi:hypothetical protein
MATRENELLAAGLRAAPTLQAARRAFRPRQCGWLQDAAQEAAGGTVRGSLREPCAPQERVDCGASLSIQDADRPGLISRGQVRRARQSPLHANGD